MSGPGFYKDAGDGLKVLFAPNRVDGPGVSLRAETHADNTYPVDGWYWADDEDAARVLLGLPTSVVAGSAARLLGTYPNVPLEVAISASQNLLAILPTFEP